MRDLVQGFDVRHPVDQHVQLHDRVHQASDLAVTERTMARLLSVSLPAGDVDADGAPPATVAKRKKPHNIPSVYIMAVTLLREKGDRHWMEASEILQGIRERWWPTADNGDVSPTLWRLFKTGKLSKDGTRYALPPGERKGRNPAEAQVAPFDLSSSAPQKNSAPPAIASEAVKGSGAGLVHP